MKINTLLATSIFAVSSYSYAANTDFVELGAATLKLDDLSEVTSKGLHAAINKEILDSGFYVQANYFRTVDELTYSNDYSDDTVEIISNGSIDFKFKQLSVGGGKIWTLNEDSYIDLKLLYTNFKIENTYQGYYRAEDILLEEVYEYQGSNTDSDSTDFITLETYYGMDINSFNFEVGIGVEHSTSDGGFTNFVYGAQVGYEINDNWSANINYRDAKDYNNLSANIQYHF